MWCAWVYTSWITSWFDPDRMEVRRLLVGVMLASLVMSATLPEAFDERGSGSGSAYVMIQVGRTVVVLLLLGRDHQLTPNFRRVLAWLVLTGVLWVAGGLAYDAARAGPVGGGAAAGLHRTAARLLGAGVGAVPDRGVDDRGQTPRRAVPAVRDRRPGCESILLTGATFADPDPS